MTTTITPLDQQADCPSEHGPKHAFVLLTPKHGDDAPYGCQHCPEVRLGANIYDPLVEYRVVERNVVRFINDAPKVTVNRRPITLAVASALAAALNDAVRRGMAHGVCDWHRELANLRNGANTPGHVVYSCPSDTAITMTVDGQTSVAFDGAGVRPQYLIGDFYNELEHAFRLGGMAARPVR